MQRAILLLVLIFPFSILKAQNFPLNGKVLNERNEPIAGVSILVGGGSGTTTDVEGRFQIKNLETGKKYELTFSSVGYETKTVSEVEVIAKQFNELNIQLDPKAKAGDEVIVTSTKKTTTARFETVNSAIQFQRNTNTVASVISAETIRRSPDRNTGEVIKRTPGASLQEGKFIVIRGLADRYNQAMLNGILLTSTEPDRKSFSFDLIPSSMIDNVVINKAFVPEYPGEWAGGLIQVNTKDIPTKNFFNVQIGAGANLQGLGKDFHTEKRSNLDWLGIDNKGRQLPEAYPTKSKFDNLTPAEKTSIGKQLDNRWVGKVGKTPLNANFQVNGGLAGKLFGKKIGLTLGLNYSKNANYIKNQNYLSSIDPDSKVIIRILTYDDIQSAIETTLGGLGSFGINFDNNNKVSVKAIVNVNTTNKVIERSGYNSNRDELVKGSELVFKQNTFFTTQINGEHKLSDPIKLKWYGAFNILDGYSPDQRRVLYTKSNTGNDPYRLLLSNSLSQQSGSRVFQDLSDYIYTAGGDLDFKLGKSKKSSMKAGYMLQIKDRLFDAKLFANYLPKDNDVLKQLPQDQVFAVENFGNGTDNKIAFDAIKGSDFRYMANTILNAGFLQFDNTLGKNVRIVWGLRIEHYDQLVGSVKKWDPRHTYSKVMDYLPGVNLTFKLNPKSNLRVTGSQTVIRPELRELADLNLYDFELNASVQGNPGLRRTKVTNTDIRYEVYPKAGETFSVGVFYKKFDDPIEQIYSGNADGSSSFNYINADGATTYGAELEFRKKLDFSNVLKNFTLQGNLAYINSEVKGLDRPMQAQSPYLINLGLLFDTEKGFNATLLYNQIGHRLAYIGDARESFPDIYENTRPILDFQVSQKIMNKKGEIKINITDIFNKQQNFYSNSNDKKTYQNSVVDPTRFGKFLGTRIGLTFGYSL